MEPSNAVELALQAAGFLGVCCVLGFIIGALFYVLIKKPFKQSFEVMSSEERFNYYINWTIFIAATIVLGYEILLLGNNFLAVVQVLIGG